VNRPGRPTIGPRDPRLPLPFPGCWEDAKFRREYRRIGMRILRGTPVARVKRPQSPTHERIRRQVNQFLAGRWRRLVGLPPSTGATAKLYHREQMRIWRGERGR
jgi:hypothetical protein